MITETLSQIFSSLIVGWSCCCCCCCCCGVEVGCAGPTLFESRFVVVASAVASTIAVVAVVDSSLLRLKGGGRYISTEWDLLTIKHRRYKNKLLINITRKRQTTNACCVDADATT